jgi:hypothetical protein
MVIPGVIIFSVIILGLSVGVLCNMLTNKKWDDIIKLGEMEGFVGLKDDEIGKIKTFLGYIKTNGTSIEFKSPGGIQIENKIILGGDEGITMGRGGLKYRIKVDEAVGIRHMFL